MNRLEKILGVSLAFVILGALLLGFWFWQQRQLAARLENIGELIVEVEPESSAADSGSTLGLSIRSFGMAHAVASQWQEDALLIMGINSWPQLDSPDDLTTTRGDGWFYTFYSPSSGNAASFGVNDTGVSQGQEYSAREQLNPRPPSEWRVGDDAAVEIFLANGGREFMDTETSIYMTMQLSTVEDHSRVQWLIAAVADETGHSLTMWIDAQSGEVMDTLLIQS